MLDPISKLFSRLYGVESEGSLYTILNGREAERYLFCKQLGEPFVIEFSGHALPLYMPDVEVPSIFMAAFSSEYHDLAGAENVPVVALELFVYFNFGYLEPSEPDKTYRFTIDGMPLFYDEEIAIMVLEPNELFDIDDVYLADQNAYHELMEPSIDENGRKVMVFSTPSKQKQALIARARTITPVREYNGGFVDPIIMIKASSPALEYMRPHTAG